jgi:hypothetical protein
MRRITPAFVLVFFAIIHGIAVDTLTRERSALDRLKDQEQLYVIPAEVLKIAAFDYDGVLSDLLFIKSMVYVGGFLEPQGGRVGFHLTEPQWRGVYNMLSVSSAMDPYFQDPYYIANAFLTWDAGLISEVNTLLEKGSNARDWDWTMPFFIGFNYFYFLQDNDKAADYLMQASRRPNASPMLASLASKLAFKANKTESSILFLEEIIKKTDDDSLKEIFETRVQAFRAILVLEKAVEQYRRKFRSTPANIEELTRRGIISDLPQDPYGGTYYLSPDGSVKSTTEQMLVPARRQTVK